MLARAGQRVASWLPAVLAGSGTPALAAAAFHSSSSSRDLRDFLDPQPGEDDQQVTHGRAWKPNELRLKSFEDLHKLWVVCLKERNLLLTQMAWSRRLEDLDTKEMYDKRYKKVKLTMNRIKQVLSQRADEQSNPLVRLKMKQTINMR